MTKDDGGPALPQLRKVTTQFAMSPRYELVGGMTLRDYFAIHASEDDVRWVLDAASRHDETISRIGARFRFAEMMLRFREASI